MGPATTANQQIITATAAELASRIAAGEISSREVIDAHITRIEEVNPKLNAVVLPRFEEARSEADQVDTALRSGESLGPLGGVPITIKECFDLAGMPATIGIVGYGETPATEDGLLVARLRRAGAIVLGKTNLPQLMLMHETDSPVYGRTNNPWDRQRGPGGSSGGEAAIIAAGGSPLGLGNDIGGSLRQPAHSCGICALKPTSGRLTNVGSVMTLRGLEAIIPQPGPLARSVDDLWLAFRILAAPGLDQIDCQVAPAPLGEPGDVKIDGLRVAMWTDDGYFAPSPAVRRVVEEAGRALTAAGAMVEPFQPPEVSEAMRLYFGLISADGGADLKRQLGRSPRDARIRRMLLLAAIPQVLRGTVAGLLGALGRWRDAELARNSGPYSADKFWQLTHQRTEYVERFIASLDKGRFDAVICPPYALPALKHGAFSDLATAGSYAMLMNLLGLPAGVVAAGRVRAGEETDRPVTRDSADRAALRVEAGSAGMPVGVQVAARWWREDVALAVMGTLERHFRSQGDYPAGPPI